MCSSWLGFRTRMRVQMVAPNSSQCSGNLRARLAHTERSALGRDNIFDICFKETLGCSNSLCLFITVVALNTGMRMRWRRECTPSRLWVPWVERICAWPFRQSFDRTGPPDTHCSPATYPNRCLPTTLAPSVLPMYSCVLTQRQKLVDSWSICIY